MNVEVLLVEDNPADADLIREMLPEADSFRLSPVSRLSAALDALAGRAFEAVLLDLGLPDSQGLETLSRLRTATDGVPIIISSGLQDEETAIRAVELGAQDYVIKGRFDADGLARALRYAVARAQAERVLREKEAQYRQLFDANPHPTWVLRPKDLAFLEVNGAAQRGYGWGRDELLSMSFDALVPAEARGDLQQGVDAAHAGVTPVLGASAPFKLVTRSGEPLDVELALSPIPFRGGRCVLAVATDVTENRRLHAQLLQARKMEALGRLAGGIAHDFNNALGVITGYAELLQADPQLGRVGRERVGRILKASQQSSGLTRQLLAFSRRESLKPRPMDLNEAVIDVGTILPQLIGAQVQVDTRLGQDLGKIRADPVQLQQLLMNMAANARDAMPDGGVLTIETSRVQVDAAVASVHRRARPGEYVLLTIADTGEGMDEETLARLFEPFYTTKRRGEGTGLGLSTVHGIVEQCGGFVDVSSEVGAGTVFRVHFPRMRSEAPGAAAPEAAPAARGGETVLLVEDAAGLRLMIREILETAGYVVLDASGPEPALQIARELDDPIHVLLTDLNMPRMSGSELAARLVAERPATRVLFMSGYSPVADGAVAEKEAPRILEKPFTADLLLKVIRGALDDPEEPPR